MPRTRFQPRLRLDFTLYERATKLRERVSIQFSVGSLPPVAAIVDLGQSSKTATRPGVSLKLHQLVRGLVGGS
jgi:hypothetical protein